MIGSQGQNKELSSASADAVWVLVEQACLWMTWGLGLFGLVVAVFHAFATVVYPLQIDYAEATVLHMTEALAQARPLYPDPRVFPWCYIPYTPLFAALAAALQTVFHDGFAAGRLLASLASLAVLLLVGLIVHRRWGRGEALTAMSLVACSALFVEWAPLNRVDTLALALELSGLYLVEGALEGADGQGRQSLALAGLLFALAFWTKQTFVTGLFAASLWLLPRSPKRLIWLVLFAALGILGPYVWIEASLHGRLTTVLFTFNALPWSAELALLWGTGYLASVALSLPGAALSYGLRFRESGPWPWYWCASLLAFVAVGRTGAYYNYYLPLHVATAIGVGYGYGRIRVGVPASSRRGLLALALLVQVGGLGALRPLPPIMLAPAVRCTEVPVMLRGGLGPWVAKARVTQAALDAVLKAHPGPVLAENMGGPLLCGRLPLVCDPHTYFALAAQGRWDEAPLDSMLTHQQVAVVLLQQPKPPNARFSPQVLNLVDRYYEPTVRLGVDWVYLPKVRR